jgi:hypothetical protein
MEALLRVNGSLTVKITGDDEKQLLEGLHHANEVFFHSCGMPGCKAEGTRFQVRQVDDNKYYEVICTTCGAKLALGQHKKFKTLFPRRKDPKTKEKLPNNGWAKWHAEEKNDDAAE